MGKILLKDFKEQRPYLITLMFMSILMVFIGYAFKSIYDFSSLFISLGLSVVFLNSFFKMEFAVFSASPDEDFRRQDEFVKKAYDKMVVRAKYCEMIITALVAYVLFFILYILDMLDKYRLVSIEQFIDKATMESLYLPLIFILIQCVLLPIFINKSLTARSFIVSVIIIAVIISAYSVLSQLFVITEITALRYILPTLLVTMLFVSYMISISIVLKKK